MAYHSLGQRKRIAVFNNTIIMRHGRGVDKALVAEYKPLELSQNATDTLLVSTRTRYKSKWHNKSATVSLCKYWAVMVTHLNVRTAINMQTLKFIFFKK